MKEERIPCPDCDEEILPSAKNTAATITSCKERGIRNTAPPVRFYPTVFPRYKPKPTVLARLLLNNNSLFSHRDIGRRLCNDYTPGEGVAYCVPARLPYGAPHPHPGVVNKNQVRR